MLWSALPISPAPSPEVVRKRFGILRGVGLLERDGDLAALLVHWDRARDGSGGMVIVGGESGAGKTTLVQAFNQELAGEAPVLWGACDPLSTPRPLGPLHDVADELGGAASALLRDAGHSHEIFAAVFEHLRLQPTILVVEDLHWADQGTIDLLRFLLRRIGATRSMIIGTVRRDEIAASHPFRTLLGDTARSPDAFCLDLRALSLDAVASLVGDRPLDPSWLHELTGGNAFFVAEMLDHGSGELPVTVRDAILARTADLDAEARAVLDLLACAPEAIPDQLLPVLGVGIPPLRALDEAGLIRRGRRGVTFRHDLCRLAIVGSLPPGGEVALHRRMLEALECCSDPDPAVLTHHAVGSGDAERTLRHASVAGVAASRAGAHRQAAAFFETALEHGAPETAREEAALLELLAAELYLIDRLEDAIDACKRAIALREEAGDATGLSADHEALSVYEWYNANRSVAERHASEAVAVVDRKVDLGQLGHAHAMQAYLALQATDLRRARESVARARQIAVAVHDRRLDVRIGLIEGICAMLDGEDDGRQSILSILGSATEHFDEIYSSGYSNLAYLDVEQRRLRDAAKVLEVSLPLTVERDVPICHVWQLGARGRLHVLEGDWAAAVADAESVLGAPSAPLARTWPHLVRGLVALRQGGEADEDLETAWELACRFREPLRLLPAVTALVERSWLLGTPDARIDEAVDLLHGTTGAGLEWARGDLAVWLRRLDPSLAVEQVAVAEPHRLQLAGSHLAAAEAWAELASPYDQALALVDSQEADAARAALDLLDRLGATAVAAKVRQDLRDRGMTAVPARRRATTRKNPAGLTDRQVEVLRLLDEGLTNAELAERLYISPKTADHHVSAILSKLGVTSRRHAGRAGRELGIIE